MKIIYVILYISLYIILLSAFCQAYTGEVPTNITINVTNTSIEIWNNYFSEKIDMINWSNTTHINKTYRWNLNYEYDFSGQNVTIITYNSTCEYSAESLDEIRNTINNTCSGGNGEMYYQHYLGCFTNYTICKEYKNNNEEFKSKFESCDSTKNTYYQNLLKYEGDYYSLNNTYNTCVMERGNFSGQRAIYFVFGGVVCILGTLFFIKYLPEIKKHGKFGTSKELSPDSETINPDEVKQKGVVKKDISPKKQETMINPEDVSYGGKEQ